MTNVKNNSNTATTITFKVKKSFVVVVVDL